MNQEKIALAALEGHGWVVPMTVRELPREFYGIVNEGPGKGKWQPYWELAHVRWKPFERRYYIGCKPIKFQNILAVYVLSGEPRLREAPLAALEAEYLKRGQR